ncbi:MAG: sigma-70 family RNA polymerase sigma factor [Acidimicrobiia bacterium]
MNDRSFEDFYMKEYRHVLVIARVLMGDRIRAEDVTQDAFVAALDAWGRLKNPEGWIRRVVANKARSAWRRRYAEKNALKHLENEVHVGGDLPKETEAFWANVRSLPPRQAQAVVLFYLEDRPVHDVATILGCSESTARVHLTRGRRRLAKSLGVNE